MKILIADDNKKIRDMIKTLIVSQANEIFECDNGFDAVRIYEQRRPDCVLMDIEMRPIDGFRATMWIKNEYPNAKIIIVTQHDNAEFREKAFRVGADNFLSKENLIDLRKVINDVVSD